MENVPNTESTTSPKICGKCGAEKKQYRGGGWSCLVCNRAHVKNYQKTGKGKKVKQQAKRNYKIKKRAQEILDGERTPVKRRKNQTRSNLLHQALALLARFNRCWTMNGEGFHLYGDKLPELHSIREDTRRLLDTPIPKELS